MAPLLFPPQNRRDGRSTILGLCPASDTARAYNWERLDNAVGLLDAAIAGAGGSLWTDTGTTLTPSGAYANLLTLDTGGNLTAVGSARVRIRSTFGGDGNATVLYHNWAAGAGYDNTKPVWQLHLRSDTDQLAVWRSPPAGSLVNLLTLDNAGHLNTKAMATQINSSTNQSISANTWTTVTMPNQGPDSSGGTMPLPASSQIKSPNAGWLVLDFFGLASGVVTGYILITGTNGWCTPYNTNSMGYSRATTCAANALFTVQVNFSTATTLQQATFSAIWIAAS